MDEPRWLTRQMVDLLHDATLRDHGGLSGVRDENALESALARPKNKWHYTPEACDWPTLGAAYGYGFAMSHACSDGNKRLGFLAMVVFLEWNGWRLTATQEDATSIMLAVADNRCDEAALAAWLSGRLVEVR